MCAGSIPAGGTNECISPQTSVESAASGADPAQAVTTYRSASTPGQGEDLGLRFSQVNIKYWPIDGPRRPRRRQHKSRSGRSRSWSLTRPKRSSALPVGERTAECRWVCCPMGSGTSPGAAPYTLRTGRAYRANCASPARSVIPSVSACATNSRSKGSDGEASSRCLPCGGWLWAAPSSRCRTGRGTFVPPRQTASAILSVTSCSIVLRPPRVGEARLTDRFTRAVYALPY